jgi:hypothetical protein
MHLIAPTGYRVAPRTPIVRCYTYVDKFEISQKYKNY